MQKFKVKTMLSDEHWADFQHVVSDRHTTIDSAMQWLAARGYTISRSALGRYLQASRGDSLFTLRVNLGLGSDKDARRLVQWITAQLPSRELLYFSLYGNFLLEASRAASGYSGSELLRGGDPALAFLPEDKRREALQRRACVEELRKARAGWPGKMNDWLPSLLQKLRERFPRMGISRHRICEWDRLYVHQADLLSLVDAKGVDRRSAAAREVLTGQQ